MGNAPAETDDYATMPTPEVDDEAFFDAEAAGKAGVATAVVATIVRTLFHTRFIRLLPLIC